MKVILRISASNPPSKRNPGSTGYVTDQENTEHGFTNTLWNYHLLLGQVLLSLNILLCISSTLTNSTYRVLNFSYTDFT